jgi:isoleucyl-tRNA synthetase
MGMVIDIVTQGRAARNAGNMKTRQPLPEMFVVFSSPVTYEMRELDEIILEELNVKKITFIDDASEFSSYKLKPQLRTLGKRYGKILPKISEALNGNPDGIMEKIKSTGTWTTTIKDEDKDIAVELTIDDLLVETTQKEGFAIASDKYVTVVLDTRLTPELIEEGNMRELISKLQTMRREAGFEVTDRIYVGFVANTNLSVLAEQNNIAEDLLADTITVGEPPEGAYVKEWNINGENVGLWVKKV